MSHSNTENIKIRVADLTFSYRGRRILNDVSVDFAANRITALTGPSGVG
jgi:ABC-type phosphate transport system ATPase subunit